MTPKEKAKELQQLFAQELIDLTDNEELLYNRITECSQILAYEVESYLDGIMIPNPFKQYWKEVRKEIDKL